jgi:hypothetical protein
MGKGIVVILVEKSFDDEEFIQKDKKLIEIIEVYKENLLLEGVKILEQKSNLLITDRGKYYALFEDFLKIHSEVLPEDFEPPSLN